MTQNQVDSRIKLFSKYKLEKKSPVPLYFQIEKIVREKIHNGELKEGDRLPTEVEFMEEFGVSRPTLRQAIANLNRDGLIDIKKGYGTFIKIKYFEEPVLGIRSYSEEAFKQGYESVTKILYLKVINADPEIVDILNTKEGEDIFKLNRLRILDDEPTAIDTSYIPVKIVPKFSIKDLKEIGEEQSLYRLLKLKYGIVISSGEEIIDSTVVNKEEADLLKMENKSPINLRKRTLYDNKNNPILYMTLLCKTRYKIRLEGPF